MKDDDLRVLAQLLRGQRLAGLGTLHDGAPLVTLTLFAAAPDFAALYLHLSQLALHTQDLRADPRASLLIAESERASQNPLTLARVSLQGEARPLALDSDEQATARALYTGRFPFTNFNFSLPDFRLYRFTPRGGRFVGGFARAADLTPEDLRAASALTED